MEPYDLIKLFRVFCEKCIPVSDEDIDRAVYCITEDMLSRMPDEFKNEDDNDFHTITFPRLEMLNGDKDYKVLGKDNEAVDNVRATTLIKCNDGDGYLAGESINVIDGNANDNDSFVWDKDSRKIYLPKRKNEHDMFAVCYEITRHLT